MNFNAYTLSISQICYIARHFFILHTDAYVCKMRRLRDMTIQTIPPITVNPYYLPDSAFEDSKPCKQVQFSRAPRAG